MSSLKNTGRALGVSILLLLAITVPAHLLAGSDAALHLYRQPFEFVPAHWTAEKFLTTDDREHACYILGASTGREGFDEDLMNASVPGCFIVNAASSATNIETFEAQALMARRFDLRPSCFVLPLHAWLLFPRPPNFVEHGYSDFLSMSDFASLASNPLRTTATLRAAVITNALVPQMRFATQLGRIYRSTLLTMTGQFGGESLPLPAELIPHPRYFYTRTERYDTKDLERVAEGIAMFDDAAAYEDPYPAQSLRHTLDLLGQLSSCVLVIRMPESTMTQKANRWAEPKFEAVLAEYGSRLQVLDLRGTMDDDMFLDHGHPLPRGREQLSKVLADYLRTRERAQVVRLD